MLLPPTTPRSASGPLTVRNHPPISTYVIVKGQLAFLPPILSWYLGLQLLRLTAQLSSAGYSIPKCPVSQNIALSQPLHCRVLFAVGRTACHFCELCLVLGALGGLRWEKIKAKQFGVLSSMHPRLARSSTRHASRLPTPTTSRYHARFHTSDYRLCQEL